MRIARETVHHPLASLRCMHLRQPAFGGGLHRHGHAELTWIERGQGLRWVGDSVEPFFEGDLVLLGAETPHVWTTRGPVPKGGCEAIVLQFPSEGAAWGALAELRALPALLARAGGGLQVTGAAHEELQTLLPRLRAATGARRLATFIEVLAVLLEHPQALRPLSAHDGRGRGRRVDAVLDWIGAHLTEDLRAEEAAARAHVTPAAFARFFRREVGKSFTAYVNDARCSWAALRLLESREPVAAIAQACGFAALSNFGEQFRRRHGMSPREYRRRAGLAEG